MLGMKRKRHVRDKAAQITVGRQARKSCIYCIFFLLKDTTVEALSSTESL